ncbi:cation:dicarboxylase symporter family transporter [Pseudonocardia sp. KRD-184]|uniref:Cation:dicarboxylase symporter family transporter n=1 Tax=Pseudonocardia oceani TaxID=2792013 RepID=A0ABS6UDW7_9PSEU|nr:cation:dicarboxylase symporter family transporter [Pseudonocardia oceani]MBW0094397.1 cation:dicarboxylase symporter family transporter [Pseudonocardia oceani]MBW0107910.1 cation:dicarboxylase symporter family transporter [Pseudonocardia oceani]MBW0119996.1 cation:dicarboxylase symporter family transporter [Pseudonocardia oceani]MBW0130076.1 cation:dicarboxylase symporter family transporter [Pseudonocardia oceani]
MPKGAVRSPGRATHRSVGFEGEPVSTSTENTSPGAQPAQKRDRTHYLYIAVIVAVILGVAVGIVAPDLGKSLKPIGTAFVDLIKMMISPIIFCTIVLGIGAVKQAAKVGRVGAIALGYFLTMSTAALAIGLIVGNIVQPGSGLVLPDEPYEAPAGGEGGLDIIPDTLVSPLVGTSVLQTLFVALLVGFAVQALGAKGEPILRGIGYFQKLVFKVLTMILWLAPVGAFGAIAAVVGETGWSAIGALLQIMLGFYLTCALFVFGILGLVLRLGAGINIFTLFRYLGREFLLIVSTSSSESALPRLIAKMEHLGVSRPVVGITVPTGYSFNLDGTAIYLTMASLFIATAQGSPLALGEQISLLLFMIIASKGAAGVTGAGLATLAAGLQSHRPDLVDGVGLIVGIDRFMSEARAVTNFAGNAVATVLIGNWVGEFDRTQAERVFAGQDAFDEASMVDDDHGAPAGEPAPSLEKAPVTSPT